MLMQCCLVDLKRKAPLPAPNLKQYPDLDLLSGSSEKEASTNPSKCKSELVLNSSPKLLVPLMYRSTLLSLLKSCSVGLEHLVAHLLTAQEISGLQ